MTHPDPHGSSRYSPDLGGKPAWHPLPPKPGKKRGPWSWLLIAVAAVLVAGLAVACLATARMAPAPGPPPATVPPPAPTSEPSTTIAPRELPYRVGVDIQAGTYHTTGPADGVCIWKRLKDTRDTPDSIVADDTVKGPATITIYDKDAFKTSCTWTKEGP